MTTTAQDSQISNREKRERIFRIFMHLTTQKHMSVDAAREDIAKNLGIDVETVNYAIAKTVIAR